MFRDLRLPIILGLATGFITWLTFFLPKDFWWLSKLASPWLAVAFWAGLKARSSRWAAISGAVVLSLAVCIYYVLALADGHYRSSPIGFGWLLVAPAAGALFGWLGATYRQGHRASTVWAVVILSSSFVAESAYLAIRYRSYESSEVGAIFLLAIGLALPYVLLSRNRERLIAFVGTILGGLLALPIEYGVIHGLKAL